MVSLATRLERRLAPNLRGVLWMVAAMATGTVIDIGVKLIDPAVPLSQVIWLRAAITLGVIIPFVIHTGPQALRSRRPVLQICRGLMWYGVLLAVFFALRRLSIAELNAYLFTEAMFTVLLAAVFLGETVTRRKLIAVAMGVAGVAVMVVPELEGGGDVIGIVVALGAAIGFSGLTLTGRSLARTDSALSMLFWPQLVALVVFAPTALSAPAWPNPADLGWITLVAVAALATNYLFIRAVRVAEAGVVSPAAYSAMVFSVLADVTIWGIWPKPFLWAGVVLIIAAVVVSGGGTKPRPAPAPCAPPDPR